MMSRLLKPLGIYGFWLLWPALWVYFYFSYRTRVLLVCGNEFLALETWFGSGDWILPGGGAHRHEAPVLAAQREVQEEIGYVVASERLQDRGTFRARSRGFRYDYQLFVVEISEKPVLRLQASEIKSASWFDRRTLPPTGMDREVLTAVANWWD